MSTFVTEYTDELFILLYLFTQWWVYRVLSKDGNLKGKEETVEDDLQIIGLLWKDSREIARYSSSISMFNDPLDVLPSRHSIVYRQFRIGLAYVNTDIKVQLTTSKREVKVYRQFKSKRLV